MDVECISYIVGAAISGIGLGYTIGWEIGKSKTASVMSQKCSVVSDRLKELNKQLGTKAVIVPTQVEVVNGKTTRVDCVNCNPSTKQCALISSKCIFFE
ncbi:MAG: hypothetical protein JZU49_02965 [Sulfuricurvum sp.]|nr:hypothetical protein [Sulfuricurvum sp.]